jgi:hypothetical protein
MGMKIQHGRKVMATLMAGSCGLLAIVYPDWRVDIRAWAQYPGRNCQTLGEAVGAAVENLRLVSEAIDHAAEAATVIYEDDNGCFKATTIIIGEEDAVSFEQAEQLFSEAGANNGAPVATLHTHNFPSGSDYMPGLTGEPDQTRRGDLGFAERSGLPVVAIDVGPEAPPNCAHGYNPETNVARTLCCTDGECQSDGQ